MLFNSCSTRLAYSSLTSSVMNQLRLNDLLPDGVIHQQNNADEANINKISLAQLENVTKAMPPFLPIVRG